MDERNYNMDPWERDSYETGSTRPPKNRGGLIAVLLILVIFLSGIVSALSILNIRLHAEINSATAPTGPVIFLPAQTDASIPPSVSVPPQTAPQTGGTLELNQTPEGVENIPQSGGLSLQAIYEKNIPSVVSIVCNTGSGTGVVITADGYIVTNCHVVEDASSIQVRFTDERVLEAVVVGADTISDLAVLYVQATDLTPAEFGNSSSLRVGDAVAAIGDPLGTEFHGTLTDGIVSAINREMEVSGRTMTLIQTNAALNSGNSGGPLLNCYGQVIGINTMKISAFVVKAGVEGLGFAIPSTTVKEIVDQLIAKGFVSGRPSLGISGEEVPAAYRHFYGLPAGFLIAEVTKGGSADTAGIEAGDILLGLDGKRITTAEELETVLYALDAGDTVQAVIYRDHKQLSVTLTLGEAGK